MCCFTYRSSSVHVSGTTTDLGVPAGVGGVALVVVVVVGRVVGVVIVGVLVAELQLFLLLLVFLVIVISIIVVVNVATDNVYAFWIIDIIADFHNVQILPST
jgi:hypothetical protein